MDEINLLPCPFCGGQPAFEIYEGDEYQVKCPYCFAATWIEESKEEAAEEWNRRAEHDPAIAKQGKPMVTSGCGPENGKKVLTDGFEIFA